MAAYMAVDSNPQSLDYGKIGVLELPQDTTIRGPEQVQNDFESNDAVASALTLLRQGGSKVTEGNLITLPVGNGLMYFEPVYVSQAAAASSGGGTGGSGGTSGGGPGTKASATVLKFVQQAEHDYALAQAALKRGDFAAYGIDQKALQTALTNAQKAAQGTAGPGKPPGPSPSPSP
jgi:uncharacterized membrane protein (UPF0182 family)